MSCMTGESWLRRGFGCGGKGCKWPGQGNVPRGAMLQFLNGLTQQAGSQSPEECLHHIHGTVPSA